MAYSMFTTKKTASLPDIHTTLVFKASGLLDPGEVDEALRLLGVPATALSLAFSIAAGTDPGPAGKEPGSWLACSLDCDGTIRLWPPVHSP